MNLTPKQIQALRIAVAEAIGWSTADASAMGGGPSVIVGNPGEFDWLKARTVPNYPESLDAVHEAWLTLSEDEKMRFQGCLQTVLIEYYSSDGWLICASALQRCIALLMTLAPEKWEEIQNLKD